jgi:hypothetical protein
MQALYRQVVALHLVEQHGGHQVEPLFDVVNVKAGLNHLKYNKANDDQGLNSELLKAIGDSPVLLERLVYLFNERSKEAPVLACSDQQVCTKDQTDICTQHVLDEVQGIHEAITDAPIDPLSNFAHAIRTFEYSVPGSHDPPTHSAHDGPPPRSTLAMFRS